jgi:putative FmdB family regulatory protein
MPFYEYQCESCGKDFVLLQSMGAKAEETVCPYCSEKKAKKLLSKFSSGNAGGVCSTGGHSWGGG